MPQAGWNDALIDEDRINEDTAFQDALGENPVLNRVEEEVLHLKSWFKGRAAKETGDWMVSASFRHAVCNQHDPLIALDVQAVHHRVLCSVTNLVDDGRLHCKKLIAQRYLLSVKRGLSYLQFDFGVPVEDEKEAQIWEVSCMEMVDAVMETHTKAVKIGEYEDPAGPQLPPLSRGLSA
jgi:hypothetical protein